MKRQDEKQLRLIQWGGDRKSASTSPRILKQPGSVDWAWQTLNHLSTVYERIKTWSKSDKDEFWKTIGEIKKHQLWDKIPPESPYGSYGELIEKELGIAKRIVENDVDLEAYLIFQSWGGDRKSKKFRENQGSDHYLENDRGKPYIIARLRRDHPDILADLERGKYRSARQAGIAAGFIKDVKRIQVLPDPEKIALMLKERLTPAQITKLIQLLQEEREDTP